MAKKTKKAKTKHLSSFKLNKYYIAAIFFLIWVIFLDSHSFLSQRSLDRTINDLKKEIAYTQERYEAELIVLQNIKKNPERIAREEYGMVDQNETLFIVK